MMEDYVIDIVIKNSTNIILIVFGIIVFLWKKQIENKFSKNLESFKAQRLHEFNLLLTRQVKWNEKELEVLSISWRKLIEAHKCISIVLSPGRMGVNVVLMNEEERKRFLDTADISSDEKTTLSSLSQSDQNKAYDYILQKRELFSAQNAFIDFNTYFQDNRIFLSPDIKNVFSDTIELSHTILSDKKTCFSDFAHKYDPQLEGFYENAANTYSRDMCRLLATTERLLQEKLFPDVSAN